MMIIITLILVWLTIWLLRRYVKYILLRVPYIRIDKFYLIDCLKGSLFLYGMKFLIYCLCLLYLAYCIILQEQQNVIIYSRRERFDCGG